MIKEFVDKYMENRAQVEAEFRTNWPGGYKEIVETVIRAINPNPERYGSGKPDASRVHEIDDGSYQGTLVYVIGSEGYQPSEYYFVKVGYGSCSGCDTLQAIRSWASSKSPTDDEMKHLMTLALHVVQGIKPLGTNSYSEIV